MSMKMAILATAAIGLFGVNTASSATLKATSLVIPEIAQDFTIDFQDTNLNGLFDFSELTGFSGVQYSCCFWDILISAPVISGISTGSTPCGNFQLNWCFGTSTNPNRQLATISTWSYQINSASPVPVPAALPLLATGLGALGVIGWRRKRKLAQAQA